MFETTLDTNKLTRLIKFEASMSESKYRSASGADKVDAEKHRLICKFWRSLWTESPDVETSYRQLCESWSSFAAEMNRKVEAAPKLSHGGSAGLSSIHYKWANPDAIANDTPKIAAGLRSLGLEFPTIES